MTVPSNLFSAKPGCAERVSRGSQSRANNASHPGSISQKMNLRVERFASPVVRHARQNRAVLVIFKVGVPERA